MVDGNTNFVQGREVGGGLDSPAVAISVVILVKLTNSELTKNIETAVLLSALRSFPLHVVRLLSDCCLVKSSLW